MAASYNSYTGNGSTTQRALTFSFLDRDHVHVYLDGVETALWTWVNDALIDITTAPGSGVAIKIARETPTAPLVDFVDGSTLTATDQDTALLQSIYISEEARDTANDALNLNAAGTMFDAVSKKIDNVAEPTATDHAATKNYVDTTVSAAALGTLPTPIAIANGGTGSITAALARVALGFIAGLDALWTAASAGAARVALGFVSGLDALWTAVDAAAARTALGLGGLATLSSVTATEISANAVTTAKILDANVTTAKILDANVTKAKIENVAADKLLGRGNGGGAGAPQEITLGTGLSMTGTTLNGTSTSGLTLISTQSPSGDSAVNFNGLLTSTYKFYRIIGNLTVSVDGASLNFRVDSNGGASYEAGASDYDHQGSGLRGAGTAVTFGSLSASLMQMCVPGTGLGQGIGNAAGEHAIFTAELANPTVAQQHLVQWTITYIACSPEQTTLRGCGNYATATAIDSIQVFPSSGTVSGTVKLYGYN